MPAPATLSVGPHTCSSSRLFVYASCRRPFLLPVTGKRAPTLLHRQQLQNQQCRLGHSWISGHPHNMLYKPPTAGNQTNLVGSANSATGCTSGIVHGTHAGSSNGGTSSSFLDFTGNSRYQAYNLARFSTFSAVSSSASASSPSSSGPSKPQTPDAPTRTQQDVASTSNTDRAHSNPASADAQSPISSSAATSSITTAKSPKEEQHSQQQNQQHDDKDDDWAVNESYSGHGGHSFTPSSASTSAPDSNSSDASSSSSSSSISPSSSSSNPRISDIRSNDDDTDATYESRTALQPSLSSFKSPSAIEASWRRTSETLPSISSPSRSSVLSPHSPNTAGGLDLSSSTLVQQMLFRERAPHADSSDSAHANDWKPLDQENDTNQSAVAVLEPELIAASPSLTSMMLNQTSVDKSSENATPSTTAKPANTPSNNKRDSQEEEHVSKLDIRVGIVRSVAAHPDAESLYIEQVDVGDKEGGHIVMPRTIVSGLVRHVPKDYLEGRAVIVVGNMKPSKLRGVVSQGMLLCAMEQNADGEVTKVGLLEPAEGSQAGDKVTIEGYTDEGTVPAAVLTPKRKWFEKSRVHFSVKDGVAYYKGSPFRTVQGLVRCKSISEGQIS